MRVTRHEGKSPLLSAAFPTPLAHRGCQQEGLKDDSALNPPENVAQIHVGVLRQYCE